MSDKLKERRSNKSVELNQNNFVTKGGEGSIYIIDDVVYKVCDPGKMIPEEKFKELSVLDHPHIIIPDDILMNKRETVGYRMRRVPGHAVPLSQTLTKAYRLREDVTPLKQMNAVQQIADGIRFIHSHDGCLQIDGNENNYMVTNNHEDIFFIDTNSFQTPSFPATAIMLSIRDWHVAVDPATHMHIWTQLSDWYSFAIISFYMFTAIHPFKGRHPSFPNMKTFMVDQMKACKSVLDPETEYPAAAVFPFNEVIPGGKDGAFMQWYHAVFVDNRRLPPPKDYQSTLAFIAKVREIIGSNNFTIQEFRDFQDMVIGYYERKGIEVVVTKNNLHLGTKKKVRPAERFRVGFTPVKNIPYACWIENNQVQILDLQSDQRIPAVINGTDIMSCEGRIYIQSSNNIFELDFIEKGSLLIATAKNAASIMPSATKMYQGVAIQDMFGTLMFSIFPEAGHHRQVKITEIAGQKIIDAKYERNVLMVIGMDKKSGKYARYIFRFATDWASYDVRIVDDISPTGLNFTVTEKDVCICLTEEEHVEMFSNTKNNQHIKSISDPAIDSEMKFCHAGTQVRFASGNKLFNISVIVKK